MDAIRFRVMDRATDLTGLEASDAWALLCALARRAREGTPICENLGVRLDSAGNLETVDPNDGWIAVLGDGERFSSTRALDDGVRELFELYLPFCIGRASASLVLAHVGQSLDGQIATATGASRDVTGPENIRHMHRLRALCDAVLVGACTVERDDPQLTTRLVPGDNPTRVVLDPMRRLPLERKLFTDGAARTLIVCKAGQNRGDLRLGSAEIVEVPCEAELLLPQAILTALRERGLHRIFIEGGGVTVSRFLSARALDRLHVTISPLLIGQGRPGISLPAIDAIESAIRPRTLRYALGEDVLFDCRLTDPERC